MFFLNKTYNAPPPPSDCLASVKDNIFSLLRGLFSQRGVIFFRTPPPSKPDPFPVITNTQRRLLLKEKLTKSLRLFSASFCLSPCMSKVFSMGTFPRLNFLASEFITPKTNELWYYNWRVNIKKIPFVLIQLIFKI